MTMTGESLHEGENKKTQIPERIFEFYMFWKTVVVLYLFTTQAHFLQNGFDPSLGDDTNSFGRNFERYPAIFGRYVKTLHVQVWIKLATDFVVGLGNMVSRDGLLTGYLANA